MIGFLSERSTTNVELPAIEPMSAIIKVVQLAKKHMRALHSQLNTVQPDWRSFPMLVKQSREQLA